MGYAEVSVARRPRVAVISTGDELVDPGADLAPGMIRDSNRFSLVAAIEAAGAEVVHSSRVGDTVEELRRRLAELEGQVDVLVTSGGVSVGDRDVVKLLLGETADVHFRRVFMKPGKPLTFATAGDLMIFGLPGNPVSSMVVVRALRAAGPADHDGREEPAPGDHTVALARRFARRTGSSSSARSSLSHRTDG